MTDVAIDASVTFMQETARQMFTICSKSTGTGKGMSEQEVNNLLGLFQRLAGDMENYAYFYAKPEEGNTLKV